MENINIEIIEDNNMASNYQHMLRWVKLVNQKPSEMVDYFIEIDGVKYKNPRLVEQLESDDATTLSFTAEKWEGAIEIVNTINVIPTSENKESMK